MSRNRFGFDRHNGHFTRRKIAVIHDCIADNDNQSAFWIVSGWIFKVRDYLFNVLDLLLAHPNRYIVTPVSGHGVFHGREDVCLHHAPLQFDAVQVVYLAHVTHLLNDDVVLVAYLLHTKRRGEYLIGRYKPEIKTSCADRLLRLYNIALLIVNSTLICD